MTESVRERDSWLPEPAPPIFDEASRPMFSITVEAADRRLLVRLAGEIDLATGEQLRATLNEAVDAAPRQLLLDLTGVPFISSEGIGALIAAQQRLAATGGEMYTIARHHAVVRPLELLGLTQVLRLSATVKDIPPAA